ncbi:bacterio-opsin activator domain-containing protein [Haloferacaceae archaeon DSL9]
MEGTEPPTRGGEGAVDRQSITSVVGDGEAVQPMFRALATDASVGLLAIDDAGAVVFANPAVERLWGYARAELRGMSLSALVSGSLADARIDSAWEYFETGEWAADLDEIEAVAVHKTGHELPIEVSFRQSESGDASLVCTARLATDKRRLADEARMRAEHRILSTTVRSIATAQTFDEALHVILKTVCDEFEWAYGDAWIPVGETLERTPTAYARSEAFAPFKERSRRVRFERGEGLPGRVWASKEIEQLLNVSSLAGSAFRRRDPAVEAELKTALGVPILVDGDVVAVLAFYIAEERAVSDRSAEIVTMIATQLGELVDRKQKEETILSHKRAVEQQRNSLAELNRINAVIRDINRMLVEATTREEIERTVCERLAASDSYRFAWIGGYVSTGKRIEPRARSGTNEGYLEQITVTADDSETGRGPAGMAIKTRSSQVVRNFSDDPGFEPWRDEALARGFRSGAAIPIVYRDATYGVLCLYADRENGFTDREITVLEELGETIGLAINAAESKRLLHAETVTELTFQISDLDSFFVATSRELSCTITLEGVVPAEEHTALYYVSVTGAVPDAVLERAERADDIREAMTVTEYEDGGLILFTVAGSSPILHLTEAGAQIESASIENGDGEIVAHIAPSTGTGTVVDILKRLAPSSTLVSQREIDRPVETAGVFDRQATETLTGKQQAVLEAAYRSGYFARPRTITGSDLAESFDITPSTFHHHLQAALNKVVGELFGDPTDT